MEKTGLAVWESTTIPQKRCAVWRFRHRSIWVERVDKEWHALSLPEKETAKDARSGIETRARKPNSSYWRHYLHRENGPVQPSPVLPDRPVVVRPDRALTILPGQSAVFFLQLPLWFRLHTTGHRPTRIFEEPLSVLTRTWFGDPATGELCWGLATRLHHSLESVRPDASVAVCALMIENESEDDLAFEKICLHVESLNVFRGQRFLWTNTLHALFKGPDQSTQMDIVRTPPQYESPLVPVSEARLPAAEWSIRRTFGMLKSFTDF